MLKGIAQHPILLGAPIGVLTAAFVHLLLRAGIKASAIPAGADLALCVSTGLSIFAFILIACTLAKVRRETTQNTKRYTHMLARMNAAEIEMVQLKARLEETASTYEVKAAQRNQRLVSEMKLIEDLVQQLAVSQKERADAVAAAEAAMPAPAAAMRAPKRKVADIDEPTAKPVAELSETELLEVIQSALEDNRIDLYLQPIVSLPQRKVARYEGFARLRSLDGELIEPLQYEAVASAAGLMPVIDNLLLFRCVQIVRRLSAKSNRRGILCRISSHSLLDSDFFPQFLEFMTENRALKDQLVFEFSHNTLDLAGTEGENNLASLATLGFTFALSDIADLKLDLAWLRRQGFRFVKADAHILGGFGADPTNDIAIDNFLTRLGRQNIELIVDGIADETAVLDVVERNIKWGEGKLFGGPRPIKRELLADDARNSAA
jgi:cyclic-di-GMP phosphodiesterase TipF (flagellum assembly factor)